MTTGSPTSSSIDPALLDASIGWDVSNWGRALQFCLDASQLPDGGDALEVGADGENGGLSLVLAHRGWHVTCSGLEGPSPRKRDLHRQHGVEGRVVYRELDVLRPPEHPSYDLVVLKSVLGHVGQNERFDLMRLAVRNLHDLLRPGGELWVLENAQATALHQLVRNRLGAGRFGWRYLQPEELDLLLAPFSSWQRASFGFTGAAGRTERQRTALGRLDSAVLEHVVPLRWRYVLAAVATRSADR